MLILCNDNNIWMCIFAEIIENIWEYGNDEKGLHFAGAPQIQTHTWLMADDYDGLM